MFIKDLLKEFSFDLQIKNYSKRTIETYKYNIDQLIIFLDKQHEISDIEDVSSLHIKRFVQYQLEIGNKSNYINTIIKSMRAFYGYLVSEEYVSHNVLAKIKLLKEDKVVIKTFTDKEVAKMIEVYDFKSYLNARNKVIIAMFVDTGIRMTELINVQSGWVNETNIRVFGKGAKWRYVSISLMLKKYMIRYERIKEGYFKNKKLEHDNYFLSRSGRPLTGVQIQNVVRNAGVKANVREDVRCSPHTLRHYSIQSNLRNGLDLYSCSRIAGHENIQVTKRYLEGLETENILELATKSSPLMNL
ncbi:tyrosine-type recombinase/integrase [Peribacillus frigoritolerans]|uniref:tyrosine-type recombinase/integrase n=1 Tax=Peribacillus frigoritolerans TaxID=450367 RepID=UPI0023DBF043|nr:tyrosine-type recombinase/integrase [Peribacillus frigoritolerans]MDF1999494.1 tyrosine-type recombinase/integrase [Peribacillus frigoritolerans]